MLQSNDCTGNLSYDRIMSGMLGFSCSECLAHHTEQHWVLLEPLAELKDHTLSSGTTTAGAARRPCPAMTERCLRLRRLAWLESVEIHLGSSQQSLALLMQLVWMVLIHPHDPPTPKGFLLALLALSSLLAHMLPLPLPSLSILVLPCLIRSNPSYSLRCAHAEVEVHACRSER